MKKYFTVVATVIMCFTMPLMIPFTAALGLDVWLMHYCCGFF